MTYYLDNIKTFLEANGYTSVYVDYMIEASSQNSSTSAIFLMAEGGQKNVNVPYATQDFAIYVRDADKLVARQTANDIWFLLESQPLQDNIVRITTRQSPYKYNIEATSLTTYIITMTANVLTDPTDIR